MTSIYVAKTRLFSVISILRIGCYDSTAKQRLYKGADMMTENLLSRITIDPKVMVGKPPISGMRITVGQILRALAGGVKVDELLQDYPVLNRKTSRLFLLML